MQFIHLLVQCVKMYVLCGVEVGSDHGVCVFVLYSNRVRLAATRALLNSLEFTKANFEKEVHIYIQCKLPRSYKPRIMCVCVCLLWG